MHIGFEALATNLAGDLWALLRSCLAFPPFCDLFDSDDGVRGVVRNNGLSLLGIADLIVFVDLTLSRLFTSFQLASARCSRMNGGLRRLL